MNQPSAPWGVPLHCDLRPLKTPTGIIRILLVVSNDLIMCVLFHLALYLSTAMSEQ